MAETQRRPVPRNDAGEIDTALAFLAFARQSVIRKTEGLDEEQLRRAPAGTGITLLGLVHHLTVNERYWFGFHVAGLLPETDWDFGMAVPADRGASSVLAGYREVSAASDRMIREAGSLDTKVLRPVDGEWLSVRWVLAHMTTETARHAGHADMLREQIDGVTGF